MFVIFYIFPSLFSSFGLIGGAHPNDHFATGQTGHFDHEHNNNLNVGGNHNNNNNIFGGYNNYNTGGGIVSSNGMPPYHLNVGGSSFSRIGNGIINNINTNINKNNIKQGHLGVGALSQPQPQLHQLQQSLGKNVFSEIGNLENDDPDDDDTNVKMRRQNSAGRNDGNILAASLNTNRNDSINQSPITPNRKSQKWQNVFFLRENNKENNTINFRL